MCAHSLSHLTDAAVSHGLPEVARRDCATTADLLAYVGEFQERKLYLPAGYATMHDYLVDELHMSEDVAYQRTQAADAARRFPVLFAALADGRLHLAAIRLLAPHLTPENHEELLEAATHKRKSEIERLIAQRLRSTETTGATPAPPNVPSAPGQTAGIAKSGEETLLQFAPGQIDAPDSRPLVVPPATERFPLPTVGKEVHDKLRYAQGLLSHAIPPGDVEKVLERALDLLIAQQEKGRFGVGTKPRPSSRRPAADARYIPADVRRAVWERDQGRCTFVGTTGHRCGSQKFVQFDHVIPVARGGTATVDGVRLLCGAHNRLEAQRVFGTGFVRAKREQGRQTAAEKGKRRTAKAAAATQAEAEAEAKARAAVDAQTQDVIAGLRTLGCSAVVARRAAEISARFRDATLEERMRAALQSLGPRPSYRSRIEGGSGHARAS
jgi:hypothetical protein